MSSVLTEAETFTTNVVVPDPADPRTVASIIPAFQALANRTKKLLALLAARLGVRVIANTLFRGPDSGWLLNGTGNTLGTANAAKCFAVLDSLLVPGCTITAASVRVQTGAARGTVSDRVTLTLRKRPVLSSGAWSVIATATDDGTFTEQTVALTAAEVVNTAAYSYALWLQAGADAGTNIDALYGGSVTLA